MFDFGEGINVICCIASMNIYVSDIVESYKDIIIGNLVNSGTSDLLLHILQCWCECAVDEDNRSLPMVL